MKKSIIICIRPFIEEVLKCEKVVVSAMCQAIGMSKETYEMLKKG